MAISGLLNELINDLSDPNVLWQVGAIAGCVAAGWLLARAVRNAWLKRDGSALVRFGIESFARILSPLLIVCFIIGAKAVMANYMNVALLKVAVPVFTSLVLIRMGFYLVRRVFARHGKVGATIATFEKIFALTMWLGAVLHITGLWPEVIAWLKDTRVPLGADQVSLAVILQAAASVLVLMLLAMWAGKALEERLMQVDGVHLSLRSVMARLSRAVLIVVAVLVSLSLVGIDLTVLSVFGGALGVGLGLGLQKIASNYVSGFIILLERSLAIGDIVSVDKFHGKVTQINTRYTVLQGGDGVEAVLPNEMLVSGAVQNHTLSERKVRAQVKFAVDYETDLDELLPRLVEIASGAAQVITDPAPVAKLANFGADGLELELSFWVADTEVRGDVLADINIRIWQLMREQKINFPFPQREIRFRNANISAVKHEIFGENAAPAGGPK
jgi:small-conductance mechanosensitive channel